MARFAHHGEEAARLFFDPDPGSPTFKAFLNAARGSKYFEPPQPFSGRGFEAELSHAGWELAEQLTRDIASTDQAFVAMWFHPGMRAAYDEGFFIGLRRAGCEPFRVDLSSHNNKIDDEIISNIRKSRILVADLTGARPNVFYEAGFAAGLGREVLYTCHADYTGHYLQCEPNSDSPPTPQTERWFEQIARHAFDVRQFQVMTWSTPVDLAKQLDHRIGRLGLRLPAKA